VGPRAGLDDMEKRKFLTLQGLELRPLGPASSYSLYQLRYPGSSMVMYIHNIVMITSQAQYLIMVHFKKKPRHRTGSVANSI
jgi:hypothetical protein